MGEEIKPFSVFEVFKNVEMIDIEEKVVDIVNDNFWDLLEYEEENEQE